MPRECCKLSTVEGVAVGRPISKVGVCPLSSLPQSELYGLTSQMHRRGSVDSGEYSRRTCPRFHKRVFASYFDSRLGSLAELETMFILAEENLATAMRRRSPHCFNPAMRKAECSTDYREH